MQESNDLIVGKMTAVGGKTTDLPAEEEGDSKSTAAPEKLTLPPIYKGELISWKGVWWQVGHCGELAVDGENKIGVLLLPQKFTEKQLKKNEFARKNKAKLEAQNVSGMRLRQKERPPKDRGKV